MLVTKHFEYSSLQYVELFLQYLNLSVSFMQLWLVNE